MQNTARFFSLLFLAASCFFYPACNGISVETVEMHDDTGRLERFQRNKKDLGKEGLYQRFTADGKLEVEAQYRQNMLQGEKKYFYPSGQLQVLENYQNDQLHGPYRKYYEDGTLKIEQNFVSGLMQGQSIRYYPNGKVEERVTMKDSEELGPFQEYYENGNLKAEGTYTPVADESAVEQGELKEYDENGQLVRIADCSDGRCITRWKKNPE